MEEENNDFTARTCINETKPNLPDDIKMPGDFEKMNEQIKPDTFIQTGWRCPVCGSVYAPWVQKCTNCGPATKIDVIYASGTGDAQIFKHPSTLTGCALNS